MKKIDQLMKELGFQKDAPIGVKEAFIKHLIKASTGVSVATPTEREEMKSFPEKIIAIKIPQQLSFDFVEEEPRKAPNKKAVS